MNTDKSSRSLIENWRKSRKCISQLINNESCSQGRGSTKSKCTWNINWTGQSNRNGPEPDTPLSDFEHTINYLMCLQYCMQTWVTWLTGRYTSAQVLDAGAEATWPAGPACIPIYLLASSYTSAPGWQSCGWAWLGAPNDMPQCCRQGALGRCRAASGLLGCCSDMACQHYLLLHDATR